MIELLDAAGVTPLVLSFLIGAAFLAGFIDSVAGGGGLISIPAIMVAGFPPHVCLGTNKFMSVFGTTAACYTFARGGFIVWKIVAVGIFFSFAGSSAGAKAVLYVDKSMLNTIFLILLPIAALVTFMSPRKKRRETEQSSQMSSRTLWIGAPIVCFCMGFYDGFFGPGTGSFLLLALHFFLGLNLVAASATAKPFNLASNVAAVGVFFLQGQILYTVAIPMAVANITGNIVGSRLAISNGPRIVRKMLVVSLSLLFATLLWQTFR